MDNKGQNIKRIPKKDIPCSVTVSDKGEYLTTACDHLVYSFLPNLTECSTFSIVPSATDARDSCSVNYQAVGITMDNKQQVLVGEWATKTISIHSIDGTRITDFKVNVHPFYLTVNSLDQLAVSCDSTCCKTVEVVDMKKSGHLLFSINAPAGVGSWNPLGVCWNDDDELFIVNVDGGDTENGVHRFSSTGKYIGCVVQGLDYPGGLTFDNDKMLVANGKRINEYVLK